MNNKIIEATIIGFVTFIIGSGITLAIDSKYNFLGLYGSLALFILWFIIAVMASSRILFGEEEW